jgi:hypothetical protein
MDILGKLRGLESRLARTVDGAAQKITQEGPREPLEILHAIVEAVERRIEPAGRGKYVFPFNRIRIFIAARSRETRARFEAVLGSEPDIQDRLVQSLRAAGCDSTGLSVDTTYVGDSETDWTAADFNIEFDSRTSAGNPSLKLTVVHGAAEKISYIPTTSRINLGRCPEVRDNRNRLIRTNHVAFVERAEPPNPTVSRHHAHIDCALNRAEYRLCDDRSAHGTSVLRDGETIPVPPGARGVRLQSGDEITLGEARIHVEIAELEPQKAQEAQG